MPKPSHIIVFDSENHQAQVIKALGLKPKTGVKALPGGGETLAFANDAKQAVHLLPEIGVVTANLTEENVGTIKEKFKAQIYKNRLRYIRGMVGRRFSYDDPPPAQSGLPGGRFPQGDASVLGGNPDPVPLWAFPPDLPGILGGSGDPVPPFARGTGETQALAAYLRGQRDLIDALLARLPQESPASAPTLMEATGTRTESFTWGVRAVGIRPGHSNYTGKGIKVAVLDTGLDLAHKDFVGRIKAENCRSFVENVASVQDGNGHGTHCCGVIGGPATPFRPPRYAVAPDCELMVGKVLDDSGSGYDSDILAGINWAVTNGARVISMSLGSAREPGERYASAYEQVARKLVRAGRDCLLVAAAGNESHRPGSKSAVGNPAACPSFMAVAAVDIHHRVAWFSCAQLDQIGLLDIAGPGVDIWSSVPDGYAEMSGTSMATPHVAGVAALYLQQDPNIGFTALWHTLVHKAIPLGPMLDYGRGLVQAP